jgi:type II secretion system protein I
MPRSCYHRRAGLTLLEVMLAIAIFGMSLAAIGELIRIGATNAAAARDLTEAQRLCNNVMAEIGAGITPPEAASDTPVEGAEGWLSTVESQPLEEQEGMLRVSVTVQQDPAHNAKPTKFTLVRWMTDPAAIEAAKAEAAAAAATTNSSSTPAASGTPTSGSTGGSPGGSSSGATGTKTGGSSGS